VSSRDTELTIPIASGTPLRAEPAECGHWLTRAAAFAALTKPRLTLLAVMAALVGYYLSCGGSAAGATPGLTTGPTRPGSVAGGLVGLMVGAFLVGGGANALNQYAERDRDALMERTADRPLPRRQIEPAEALCFGAVFASTGVGYLALTVNLLTGLAAAGIVLTYVFVYTPLKRTSRWSTLAGALPGALPVLMGWAAGGRAQAGAAWSLFAILVLWQFPHFWAICWLHREDYARAGFSALPVGDARGAATAWQAVGMCGLLSVVALMPAFLAGGSPVYLAGASAAGLGLTALALRWALRPTRAAARRVFQGSLVFLSVVMMLLVIDARG